MQLPIIDLVIFLVYMLAIVLFGASFYFRKRTSDVINSSGGCFSLDLTTFPQLFQSNGYDTALIGKGHLGEHQSDYLPLNRGYGKFIGFPHGGSKSLSPEILVDSLWHTTDGKFTSDLLTDYAMSYVKEYNPLNTGKPYYLSLHYWVPYANTDFLDGRKTEHDVRSWLPIKPEDLTYWDTLSLKFPVPNFSNLDS